MLPSELMRSAMPTFRVVQCTRWAEVTCGLKFNIELAERLGESSRN
jgi:hypothetical protein